VVLYRDNVQTVRDIETLLARGEFLRLAAPRAD
jgi:hypothetical protein